MNKISKIQNRNIGKILKQLVAVAALGACTVAQADILNFEQAVDSPFFFHTDHVQFGNFWVETYGGTRTDDFVGALVDGSTNDTCMAVSCPTNNKSTYYTGLDDGYFYFGMNDDSMFGVTGLQASFIGAGQASFPAVSGVLVLQGFNAAGSAVGAAMQLGLAGPNSAGQFAFANYDTSAFAKTYVSYVRVLGYACDASSNCSRTSNLSNFAIDNIQTVPEPTSMALFGLGVAGLAFARRRRSA